MPRRILLTGATGQVGWELARSLAPLGKLLMPPRQEFDLSRPDSLESRIDALRPDLIVNPAAYTAVDRAESEATLAFTLNRDAPAALARSCARRGIGLIHFSTDYVYPGDGDRPWSESDPVGPLNVYGASKLAGEEAVRSSGCDALIFRTCWVYGARGANFLLTMLRVGASGKPLSIVADQWGAPTSARLIATTVAAILARSLPDSDTPGLKRSGLYNLAASGITSWHGFARAIFEQRQILTGAPLPTIEAIDSASYPAAAKRPANSRLDLSRIERDFGLSMPDWSMALGQVMADARGALGEHLARAGGSSPAGTAGPSATAP